MWGTGFLQTHQPIANNEEDFKAYEIQWLFESGSIEKALQDGHKMKERGSETTLF